MTLKDSIYYSLKGCLNYNILSHLSKSIDALGTYNVAGKLYENVHDPVYHCTRASVDRPMHMRTVRTVEFIYDT